MVGAWEFELDLDSVFVVELDMKRTVAVCWNGGDCYAEEWSVCGSCGVDQSLNTKYDSDDVDYENTKKDDNGDAFVDVVAAVSSCVWMLSVDFVVLEVVAAILFVVAVVAVVVAAAASMDAAEACLHSWQE